jgi:putative Holliday junction resolvase
MTAQKILAFDLGERRIGVAVYDSAVDVVLPRPTLTVLSESDAVAAVTSLIMVEAPTLVIIGWPLTMAGQVGPQAKHIATIIDQLKPRISCPLKLVDERLTSAAGRRNMPAGSAKSDDSAAAAEILQTYLTQHQ